MGVDPEKPGLIALGNVLDVYANISAGNITSRLLVFDLPLKASTSKDVDTIVIRSRGLRSTMQCVPCARQIRYNYRWTLNCAGR